MAREAHACILALQLARVEAGSVRTDAEGAELRVALHAVRLLVTGRAAFQPLPRGLAVIQQPGRLRIVETGLQPPSGCAHADLLVTSSAEARRLVAVRAFEIPIVSSARMSLHEVVGMIARTCRFQRHWLAGAGTIVALLALCAHVTRHAALVARRSSCAMPPIEERRLMRLGHLARGNHALCYCCRSRRQRAHYFGRDTAMTCLTTFACVARRTRGSVLGGASMLPHPVRRFV